VVAGVGEVEDEEVVKSVVEVERRVKLGGILPLATQHEGCPGIRSRAGRCSLEANRIAQCALVGLSTMPRVRVIINSRFMAFNVLLDGLNRYVGQLYNAEG